MNSEISTMFSALENHETLPIAEDAQQTPQIIVHQPNQIETFSIMTPDENLVIFPDLEFDRRRGTVSVKKIRLFQSLLCFLCIILLINFFMTSVLLVKGQSINPQDYLHYHKNHIFRPWPIPHGRDGAAQPKEERSDNLLPKSGSFAVQGPNCLNIIDKSQPCEVLLDLKTASIVRNGANLALIPGDCNKDAPIPSSNGQFIGVLPCSSGGEKFIFGDCEFEICEYKFQDPVPIEGSFNLIGNKIVFTCQGEGTFIFISKRDGINENINYKILLQKSYFLNEGESHIQWSCGVGMNDTYLYVPKVALCARHNLKLTCLNAGLAKAALAFAILLFFNLFSWLDFLNPMAIFITLFLIIPFMAVYYKTHKKSAAEVVKEYMKLTGKCPMCGNIVSDPNYHVEHCSENKESKINVSELRSWTFFRRLIKLGSKLSFLIETFLLLILLSFLVINLDTVGALDVSKILESESISCNSFDVGASSPVATFIKNNHCIGTTCTGSVDIDLTLDAKKDSTARFLLGAGLFLDIRISDIFYVYNIARQYDACDSIIESSSTSTCAKDKCDVCDRKIKANEYVLKTDVPGTNEDACNSFGCVALQEGCTCAACRHKKAGNCYAVGESQLKTTIINIQIQSGGVCNQFNVDINTKSNKLLLTFTPLNVLSDMVAVKDQKVYSGTINRLGEFGGFNDLKFKTDTEVECKDNQKYTQNCHFLHTKTFSYTSCCSDTQALASQLQIRAGLENDGTYIIRNINFGTIRLIASIPDVPIERDPEDVSLTITCQVTSGCYSCASGAVLNTQIKASGPGWFDISADGANIQPNQLTVNAGDNTGNFTLFVGTKTGSTTIRFGQFKCQAAFTLTDPSTDAIDVGDPNVSNNPEAACSFICGLSNIFHLPENFIVGFFKGVFIVISVLLMLIALYLFKKAYDYERKHGHKLAEETIRNWNIPADKARIDMNKVAKMNSKGNQLYVDTSKSHAESSSNRDAQGIMIGGELNESEVAEFNLHSPKLRHRKLFSNWKPEDHIKELKELEAYKQSPAWRLSTLKEKIEINNEIVKHKMALQHKV